MRLMIATPSGNLVHARYTRALFALTTRLIRQNVELCYSNPTGPSIVVNRITSVLEAASLDCTHILWLDSDIVVPIDIVERLRMHHKSIVGATYAKKRAPYEAAFEELPTPETTLIRRVARLPGGCLLVSMQVYEALSVPYYCERFEPDQHYPVPEDYHFCDRARDIGFDVWLDAQLSCEIQHLGEASFRTNAIVNVGAK